jgi:isoamylase
MSDPKYLCLHCLKPVTDNGTNETVIAPEWESEEGAPFPLGVSWIVNEQSWNFAIYSKHAEQVTLVLYSTDELVQPLFTFEFDERRNKSGPVWHCRVPRSNCRDATYYAYRIDGPSPSSGFDWHTFDKEKILVDPYAGSIFFPPNFDRHAACQSGANDGKAPLGLLNICRCASDRPLDPGNGNYWG